MPLPTAPTKRIAPPLLATALPVNELLKVEKDLKLDAVAVQYHFVAASTNHEAMDAFGIRPEFRFGFWDWVGGRFSIWSAVGLSLALVVGMDTFRRLLNGGRIMDLHFRNTALDVVLGVGGGSALDAAWFEKQ